MKKISKPIVRLRVKLRRVQSVVKVLSAYLIVGGLIVCYGTDSKHATCVIVGYSTATVLVSLGLGIILTGLFNSSCHKTSHDMNNQKRVNRRMKNIDLFD